MTESQAEKLFHELTELKAMIRVLLKDTNDVHQHWWEAHGELVRYCPICSAKAKEGPQPDAGGGEAVKVYQVIGYCVYVNGPYNHRVVATYSTREAAQKRADNPTGEDKESSEQFKVQEVEVLD